MNASAGGVVLTRPPFPATAGRVLPRRRAGGRPTLPSSKLRTRAGANGESLYDLLGVPASGTSDEIKKAYKQLAKKYHPDLAPPDRLEEHTRRFIEVQGAYQTLSDPGRRALYDRDLAGGTHLAFSTGRRSDAPASLVGLGTVAKVETLGSGRYIRLETALAGSACRVKEEVVQWQFQKQLISGSSDAQTTG